MTQKEIYNFFEVWTDSGSMFVRTASANLIPKLKTGQNGNSARHVLS